MSLDDRAADKQPDAHAAALRGVEGIEQRVEAFRREADARITTVKRTRLTSSRSVLISNSRGRYREP
jgi:hypothetical protein